MWLVQADANIEKYSVVSEVNWRLSGTNYQWRMNILVKVSAKEVRDALVELAKKGSVAKYANIMYLYGHCSSLTSPTKTVKIFRSKFCSFYRVRRSKIWKAAYFNYFNLIKTTTTLTYDAILKGLSANLPTRNIEKSFASKMYATINTDKPILDSKVLCVFKKYLDTKFPINKDIIANINKCKRTHTQKTATDLYDLVDKWYQSFQKCPQGKLWVQEFDKSFPTFKYISAVKKIDFILWALP